MEQYKKSGPPSMERIKEDLDIQQTVEKLRQQVDAQDRRIDDLERDLRRLRNSVRSAISAANTIAANRQRNG